MTSFIVVSKEKTKRDTYLQDFCDKHAIAPFDRTHLTLETSVKQNTASIGIEDIKQMQKKIFLKPIKSKMKAVIVDDAQLLTPEAQNALLKVLEEPPQHTFIILSSNTSESFLPTIISRCFVIDLGEDTLVFSEKEKKEYETFIQDFPNWGVGERLKKAEQLAKEKDKAIVWIGKLILVLREKMLEEYSSKQLNNNIKAFQSLHTLLKTTNVNPRFAIENTLLQLT